MKKNRDYLGSIDAAKLARVSPRTIATWFDKGLIDGFLVPRSKHRRISRASLRAFLAKNDVPTDLIDAAEKSDP
jgi:Helix-turn-helix domain